MGRDALIEYFEQLIKDSESVGPEHNAFYFLLEGIEKLLDNLRKT